MAASSPPSDTSDPVIVSRPASPIVRATAPVLAPPALPPRGPSTSTIHAAAPARAPAPPVVVLKDSASETVAALEPTPGGGEPGGLHVGAEGVIGPARGVSPEWIVKVRKSSGDDAAESGTATPSATTGATAGTNEDDDADGEGDGRSKPKWFQKVKEGLSSAASSIKEKAAEAGSTSSPTRSRTDSLDAPANVGGGTRRLRSRSIGGKSTVSFQLDEDDDAIGALAPDEAKIAAAKIVTDRDGLPVPTEVGVAATGITPASSMPEGVVPAAVAPSTTTGNASVTTSVKEKILETYDVEPATTQEKFHTIFSEMPDEEELIEDYRCALQRDILVQGKLYVSEHFLSFRANILGWETALKIPWTEIVAIEKRMTAKIIPNAIEVRTLHATHTFSSFVARDASYALLVAVWKHVHPEADHLRATSRKARKEEKRRMRSMSASSTRSAPADLTDSEGDSDGQSEISFEDEQGQKKKHRFRNTLASLKIGAILNRDSASPSAASASATAQPTEADKVKAQAQAKAAAGGAGGDAHAPTSYDGPEFKNVALDTVLPTSPSKAYKLFFADADFLRAFMEEKEGLKEVEIGAWTPVDGACQERELTYLKPLNAPVGPKETHCNIRDLNEKVDEETYISNLTTTKTPDVPSGDNFSTVTRTVFTWAEGGGCHVRVTTEVEWTKVNRFLRGVIERGAVDGQVGYHKDLEAAVREHIAAHPDEYAVAGSAPTAAPNGVKSTDTAAVERSAAAVPSSGGGGGMLDTLLGLDPLTALLVALVALLALSNLFTLLALRKHAAHARAARLGHPAEVASAVERVLGQFNAAHAHRALGPAGEGAAGEVDRLGEAVRALEGQMEGVLREVTGAVASVRALVDRAEGVRGML